ncbi:MAG: hypothetical protein KGL31_07685, partial [candidate division NC10 bacterium]|nr:hypothetical protein [candidate division NC10 bacterium]
AKLERGFQSTRPRGARQSPPAVAKLERGFQSTRPRGARPFFFKSAWRLRNLRRWREPVFSRSI